MIIYPPYGLLHVICIDTYYRNLYRHLENFKYKYSDYCDKRLYFILWKCFYNSMIFKNDCIKELCLRFYKN